MRPWPPLGPPERLTEAIAVASFGEILGDSITRRMVAEYQASPFMNFEPFINYGPPLNDFRTRRVTRLGGYANLATVNGPPPTQR